MSAGGRSNRIKLLSTRYADHVDKCCAAQRARVHVERRVWLVQLEIHLGELEVGEHHLLLLQRAQKLLLGVAQHAQLIVRLAEPSLCSIATMRIA